MTVLLAGEVGDLAGTHDLAERAVLGQGRPRVEAVLLDLLGERLALG